MPLLVVPILVVLLVIALIPISIVQRFRSGTARRPARRWVASLNVFVLVFSILLVLVGATVTSAWVPGALISTVAGLAAGFVLGLGGIALTHWDDDAGRLHYTPNRWLVLAVTLLVAGRIAYGFWRGWEAARASLESASWVVASGVAGSMSAGAVVLGYYLVFWVGVRRRVS